MGFLTSRVQFPFPGAPHLAETWSCTESAQIGSSTPSAAVWGGSSLIPAPHPVRRGPPSLRLMLPPWAYALFLCWPGWESRRPAPPHFPLLCDFALGSWQRLPPSSATRSTREPGCWPGGSGPDRGWGHGVTAEDRELCLGTDTRMPSHPGSTWGGRGGKIPPGSHTPAPHRRGQIAVVSPSTLRLDPLQCHTHNAHRTQCLHLHPKHSPRAWPDSRWFLTTSQIGEKALCQTWGHRDPLQLASAPTCTLLPYS